jgi:hypothetical protein
LKISNNIHRNKITLKSKVNNRLQKYEVLLRVKGFCSDPPFSVILRGVKRSRRIHLSR